MGYEDMRRHALGRRGVSQKLGLAVLLGRGVAAWMRAWVEVAAARESTNRHECGSDVARPVEVPGEIVMVVASMALSAREEA